MASPEFPTRSDRSGSTAGAFGRMVQGMVLERFTIGVVLMGLVDIVAAFAEATGAARVLALVVGAGVVVVTIVGWRRRWPDPVMWGAMLVAAAAAFAAFVVAVTSGG
jgi:hypothetical protein